MSSGPSVARLPNRKGAPWALGCFRKEIDRSVCRTSQVLSGANRFVLSSSGHIAGIVNPPSPKARLWTNDALPADPDEWTRHKQAQEYEAKRRQEVRSVYYTSAMQEFVEEQKVRHEDRCQMVNDVAAENAANLEQAYEQHRAPEELQNKLEEARAQIEQLRRRQAERSPTTEREEALAYDRGR